MDKSLDHATGAYSARPYLLKKHFYKGHNDYNVMLKYKYWNIWDALGWLFQPCIENERILVQCKY